MWSLWTVSCRDLIPESVTRRSSLGLVVLQDELGGLAGDPAHLAGELA
jgi:hypothetical protein